MQQVRKEDSLALITFADKPKFEHVLSQNRQWTLDAIDKYVPLGGTSLYDALWNSLLHLKPVKARRAVVILTDGRDENNPGTAPGSIRTLDEVLEFANISRPMPLLKSAHRRFGNRIDLPIQLEGVFHHEVPHQPGNVVAALSQRRHINGEYMQPVIQIAAKLALRNHFA